jgi:cytochrome P450
METATLPGARVAWDAALVGWTVTGYELVKQVLRDTDRFTSEGGATARNLGAEALLANDSPVHAAVRAIWARPFGVSAVVARRRALEALAAKLLAPALAELERGETIDIVPVLESYAAQTIFGLVDFPATREAEYRNWYQTILDTAAFSADGEQARRQREAKDAAYAFLESQVEDKQRRLAAGGTLDDLVSLIVAAEGQPGMTRAVTLDNLFNVFIGGADTTIRWMGNAIATLHRHPRALDELRADPTLLPQALEEVMRIETVTRFAIRAVRVDGVALEGQPLRRGDTVYVMTSRANRDPAAFDDPDRFDLHRKAKPHLGFSHGIHQCIGMNLARVEVQAFLGTLLAADAPRLALVDVDYGDDTVVRGPERLLLRAI